ncbi:hypothetical protein ACFVAJ_18085 [Agromyces sp. NPDC057679]|uniref:hypothetical protein n=1 Tax=Agromyces sp. NPDC057679 TaxID=3346207 RepID=UPI00366AE4EA
MSADNFWLVRRVPTGFVVVMGFESDDSKPQPRGHERVFETPEEALDSVIDDYAEYGHQIDPECFLEDEEWELLKTEREDLLEQFRWLLEQEDRPDPRDILAVVEERMSYPMLVQG